MNRTTRIALPLLLAAFSPALHAQQGWQAGGGLALPMVSLTQFTHGSLAMNLQGAYEVAVKDSNSTFRYGVDLDLFPGSTHQGGKVSVEDFQLNADIVVPLGTSTFKWISGLSVNTWFKQVSGVDPLNPAQPNEVSGTVKRAFGKLGFRTGLERKIDAHWSAQVLLQLTELGTDNEFLKGGDPVWGRKAVNPSWVQVTACYHF